MVLWKIQATVIGIGKLKTWAKANSSGKFKTIQLQDRHNNPPNNRIQLTFFNTAVDKFEFLQVKADYVFSEGSIKPSRFRDHIKHPYQINMDDKCGKVEAVQTQESKKADFKKQQKPVVEEKVYYKSASQVPQPSFHFLPIKDIVLMPN